MTRHYSALSLFKEGLAGQKGWQPAWRSPEPKPRYDALIIGAGGHGLATAYYLARNHGITNVAVIDKGWLGGGNTGRAAADHDGARHGVRLRRAAAFRRRCASCLFAASRTHAPRSGGRVRG